MRFIICVGIIPVTSDTLFRWPEATEHHMCTELCNGCYSYRGKIKHPDPHICLSHTKKQKIQQKPQRMSVYCVTLGAELLIALLPVRGTRTVPRGVLLLQSAEFPAETDETKCYVPSEWHHAKMQAFPPLAFISPPEGKRVY